MRYEELHGALLILGLPTRASLAAIKARHRQLVKLHHPDASRNGDSETIRRINAAYRLVLEYIGGYRFCFEEEEFYEQNPEERVARQFMDTPLWGAK